MVNPADHAARFVSVAGGVNFRDLGGYTGAGGRRIRWRHLYRSGATHQFDDAARRRLVDLGVRVAVDLRSAAEQREHPHGLAGLPDVAYVAADHDGLGGNLMQLLAEPQTEAAHLREEMLELYRNLPYEFSGVYRRLFLSAAEGPLPLVFSCAAGKDRTGVAAALLLHALGVSWQDIEADYLLTEQFIPDIMRALLSSKVGRYMALIDPEVVAPVFSADRAYLGAMREAVAARSGSLDAYLRGALGLGDGVLDVLRGRLLA
jgi:protein-tyrosine phosphatase